MDTSWLLDFHRYLLIAFYKEGVVVAFTYCFMFFALAAWVFRWALSCGELKDLETAKLEMMELP